MREQDSVAAYLVQVALHRLEDEPARKKAVLDEAGIDPRTLEIVDARLPATAVNRFWLAMVRELDDEFFGFDSHGLPRGSFALICRGLIQEPTLGKALRQCLTYLGLFIHDIRAHLEVRGGRAVVSLRTSMDNQAIRGGAEEIYLNIVLGVLCWLVGRRIPLDSTRFSHPRPAHRSDPLLWGPLLEFDAACTEVAFDASYLALPVVQDLAALKHFLRTSPQWLIVRIRNEESLAARVFRRLRQQEDHVPPTLVALAEELGMSAAGFRRQLEREGFSYQEIKHEVRRSVAFELLRGDRYSIGEIAIKAGFQEPSAFHRAFRSWTGESPGHFRKRVQQAPADD
ncbi:AraC family transcriptional regulator [Pseudomonas sp. Q1-7]|uniref:AraC family transcriptional regulator n=1 Tax=Pseudomonas sp. Q1-7 TaxID=3020843 RepID=UPI002301CC39|nr:AraC family transcriptional regulator [Pseudomonas sp. Q1-7]